MSNGGGRNMNQADKKEIWDAIDKLREMVNRMGENMTAQITRVTENFNAQISELNKFIYQNLKKDGNGNPIMAQSTNSSGFDAKVVAAVIAGIGLICSVMFQINNSNNMQIKFLAQMMEKNHQQFQEHVKIGGHPQMVEKVSRLETEIAVSRDNIRDVKDKILPDFDIRLQREMRDLDVVLQREIELKTGINRVEIRELEKRLDDMKALVHDKTLSRYTRQEAEKDIDVGHERDNKIQDRVERLEGILLNTNGSGVQ